MDANDNIDDFFQFLSSGSNTGIESAFRLAKRELQENIDRKSDGEPVFRAGFGWGKVWTRDSAYANELGAALLFPSVAKQSMAHCITDKRDGSSVWTQDACSHFGVWPALTDSIVGARGALAYFMATKDPDLQWLERILNTTLGTLKLAENDILDSSDGLFRGCSSFMESNGAYPDKYESNGRLVAKTKALSTNMLYLSGYRKASVMAEFLERVDVVEQLTDKAARLQEAIQNNFWMPDKGYYSYLKDAHGVLLDQMEGLGEALALLELSDSPERITTMFRSIPTTDIGFPCLWPQFNQKWKYPCTPDMKIFNEYHNGRIWPFVQGYWARAAAEHGQVQLLVREIQNLVELSERKNTFAEFYELDGSFPDSRKRQLWSDTAFLSMIIHGIFGVRLESPQGINFAPIKPVELFAADRPIHLRNFKYRHLILHIEIRGSGRKLESIRMNNVVMERPFLEATHFQPGSVDIVITLVPDQSGEEIIQREIASAKAVANHQWYRLGEHRVQATSVSWHRLSAGVLLLLGMFVLFLSRRRAKGRRHTE